MSRRRYGVGALIGVAVTVTLVLSGCGSTNSGNQLQNSNQLAHKTEDINPRDPSTLVDGNFVWPLDQWEPNWNFNEVDGGDEGEPDVFDAYLPRLFLIQPDSSAVINHDYLTSATVTDSGQQVVTYNINPKAKWSNGDPLIWSDLKTQWLALNGSNPAFEVNQSTGYNDISSITEGTNPYQAIVTFKQPFAEWQYLFSRLSPLYPPSVNATPQAFNTALINGPSTISAGPFIVTTVDKDKQTIIMTRNPDWWGAKPVLSKIVYQVVERDNRADALANGEVTETPLFADADLYKRAQKMPNVAIRESIADNFNDLWFNGRSGALLGDLKLRTAMATGLNGDAFTKAIIGTIEPNPTPVGNHLYLPGTQYHQDHSGITGYNLAKAKSELDADGWKLAPGKQYRTKNGQELDLSILDASVGDPEDALTNKLLISQLATLGAKGVLNAVPEDQYQADLDKGEWDITSQGWIVSPFPISGMETSYYLDPNNMGQNFSQIGSTQINNLFNEANATLDPAKRAQLGNQIDTDLWNLADDLIEFQSPGVRLVNKNVANFGAFGFADIDYTKIGFIKS
ncbi:MAG TPA: ABC transporter family substrate-binding protein [Pseudonocardiaceae bacterium]|nr:ABC transporter family substrate-binding protein [Pseudonocardiaceae bacterium]